MTYVEKGLEYARDVIAGKIPACKWVKLTCERQFADLQRRSWEYTFDHTPGNKICELIELLPHVKGKWETRNIVLEPWQCFNLTTVFGWKHKKKNIRRFNTSYTEVPRKNGKSTLSAGVGLYMLLMDGEPGSEVYSAATTRDQAKIVWGEYAKVMALRSPQLQQAAGLKIGAHALYVPSTASKFEPLSADSHTLEGKNVHCGIIDELHAHPNRKVYDVIDSGTGSRKQPLIWIISTAGSDQAGICYEQNRYTRQILNRVHEDENYFGIIYTIDENDDWTSPEVWAKANPNFGKGVIPEDIARKCAKAQQVAAAQNNFLTKHLNVWVNADTAWMDMLAWDKCGDGDLDISRFEGEECWTTFDLASKIDIAARVHTFLKGGDVYAFGRYYVPEARVEQNDSYAGWVYDGRMVETPGQMIDYDWIEQDLLTDGKLYNIQEVGYDPMQAHQFSTRMANEGFNMIEIQQNMKNMSEPMKELEGLVYSGRFHHDGDPVLKWMVSNTVCHRDAKDNIFPRKESEERKIDGVVATIMGINRIMFRLEESVYNSEDLMWL